MTPMTTTNYIKRWEQMVNSFDDADDTGARDGDYINDDYDATKIVMAMVTMLLLLLLLMLVIIKTAKKMMAMTR